MWTKEFLGTDVLQLTQHFIIYSMLGWLVESIYMSWCNKKITNRGFATSPFCPIYGFGGVLGYLILRSLSDNVVILYISGAIIATIFEFLVAKLMKRLFGEVWWDYSEKPMNYKGVICMESTIAWGFYAVIIVNYLHHSIAKAVNVIPPSIGIIACRFVLTIYAIDFLYHFARAMNFNIKRYREYKERMKERYQEFRARF